MCQQCQVGCEILVPGDALTAHLHIVLGCLAVPFTRQAQILQGVVRHTRGTGGKAAEQPRRAESVFANFFRLFLAEEVLHATHDRDEMGVKVALQAVFHFGKPFAMLYFLAHDVT